MEKIYYIYKITNNINGKSYIGFTENIKERWRIHKKCVNAVSGKILHQSIKKHGWNKFTKEVLYCSKDGNHTLREMEPYFIKKYNTFWIGGHGYNMTQGGEGILGFQFTKEIRKKMSESHLGIKNHFYHKKHSKLTKSKMSIAAKSRPIRIGKDAPNYGKVRSEITNQKVREKLAKSWIIIHPDSSEENIINLKQYCREHELSYVRMLEIISGRQNFHKGYSIRKPNNI